MSATRVNDHRSVVRAKEIAKKTLEGEFDPLLASRDLVTLRSSLPDVVEEAWDTLVAVASEVDDLPIGNERQQWAPDALKAKDVDAGDYRARVKETVMAALKKLVAALEQ